MKFLRNRLQLGRWPLRKQRKGICVSQETGRRFLTKQYVCSKEKKKKIVGVGGERRQDFPAGKNKRNLKVIATLSNL